MSHIAGAIDGKHISVNAQRKQEHCITIVKVFLALFCWEYVMVDTVLLFLMLVNMAATMIAAF